MQAYVLRRLIAIPFMLIGITLLLFFLLFLRPGNAALTNFGLVNPDQACEKGERGTYQSTGSGCEGGLAKLEKEYGLDRPFFVQYGDWAIHAIQGDLGLSLKNRRSISAQIGERLPTTIEIGLLTILISTLIGVPVGIISAIRPGTLLDGTLRITTILGISIPNFWVGTLALTLPALWWGWTPLARNYVDFVDSPLTNLSIVIWPALVLAIGSAAYVARIVRSSMLETLYSDFTRTARAKGLTERIVVLRHVFRSSMITVLTVIGVQLGAILGGSVIAEQIFAVPGLGLLIFEAIMGIDYTLVLGGMTMFALMFMLVTLAVDLLYTVVDPRIRY
ncbi:MAG: ABC transporter permease [Tepidiformaceae bacterium]